jgi:hypothetical protein
MVSSTYVLFHELSRPLYYDNKFFIYMSYKFMNNGLYYTFEDGLDNTCWWCLTCLPNFFTICTSSHLSTWDALQVQACYIWDFSLLSHTLQLECNFVSTPHPLKIISTLFHWSILHKDWEFLVICKWSTRM